MSKETRRLFFALDLSERHNAQSRQAIIDFKATLAAYGRPVPDDNLHITLAFLGEVDNLAYRRLCAVADTLRSPPLALTSTQTGYFSAPAILWLGLSDNRALRQLAATLQAGAADILQRPAEYPFTPHISLLRRAQRPDTSNRLSVPLHFQRFGIYASVTDEHSRGVRYQCLNHWTLTD